MNNEIRVLDKGFVRLDAAMADDLGVVNAARVSLADHHDEMQPGDEKLIASLMRNRHGSTFEHNLFRFVIKCPIFIARQWMRHRISSFNEISARYTELGEPEFYIPEPEQVRTQIGKAMSYQYEMALDYEANPFVRQLVKSCRDAASDYQTALTAGIAKEQARMFLPVNVYTQFYWSVNARSLMNFLSLRNAPQAQQEIRAYAEVLESIFAACMPITAAAFIENGRVAP